MNKKQGLKKLQELCGYSSILEISGLAALEKVRQISTSRCKSDILFTDISSLKLSGYVSSNPYSFLDLVSDFVIRSSALSRFTLNLYSDGAFSPLGFVDKSVSNIDYSLPSSFERFHNEIIISGTPSNSIKSLLSFISLKKSSFYLLLNGSTNETKLSSSIDKMFYNESETQKIMRKYLK